jgi:hypothetical protein
MESLSGNVTLTCKNPECGQKYNFGFVLDTLGWIEGFQEHEITCPVCEQTYRYAASDLRPIFSKELPDKPADSQ